MSVWKRSCQHANAGHAVSSGCSPQRVSVENSGPRMQHCQLLLPPARLQHTRSSPLLPAAFPNAAFARRFLPGMQGTPQKHPLHEYSPHKRIHRWNWERSTSQRCPKETVPEDWESQDTREGTEKNTVTGMHVAVHGTHCWAVDQLHLVSSPCEPAVRDGRGSEV